ncbi:hypothetical protein CBL_20482 [Carabus blaptoides fortunei]
MHVDVSVIIPIFNGEKWIDECFNSILNQTAVNTLNIEVCVCNDASNDKTKELLDIWRIKFESNKISFKVYENTNDSPNGVGYGKNIAINISSGTYLCFQDIDDVMMLDRILKQYETARDMPDNVLIGTQFIRDPADSTARYTKWANTLTPKQLNDQIYTSYGPTVIMPTWFCHRNVFNRIGGFCEDRKGTPEDLIFFYKHLDINGRIARVDMTLLIYRYHPLATTFSINEQTIWDIRIIRLENKVIQSWREFTIWNAGKQGKKFYRCLKKENQNKVIALCDVDKKKIGKYYELYDEMNRKVITKLPIIHFREAKPPFILCVKLDMTDGVFEQNLRSLNLEEGKDYIYFS